MRLGRAVNKFASKSKTVTLACATAGLILAIAGFQATRVAAAEADPLNGFAPSGLSCPKTPTGVAEATMANSQGEQRLVQTTYQSGIATLVAVVSQAPDHKNTYRLVSAFCQASGTLTITENGAVCSTGTVVGFCAVVAR
jgi:hypothetical protein